jgi:cellulose synthase/poly-beta-1,6-N-acetylglucosamine synthase-like glycosyltransferase
MPRVSVIIPAFNAAAHLAETLQSVCEQTYDDWEVAVVDDASTDATIEIARQFGKKFKTVASPRNEGPAAARNLGIVQSTGELLAFLDADDYWLPTYLEQQVGLFDGSRQHGGDGVGIVACNARVLGPEGFLPGTYSDYIGSPEGLTVSRLLVSNPIFVSALSPREVVEEVGGFCPDITGTEDHDLWLRILELGFRVVINRSPLAVYRVSSDSISADTASMARAAQTVYGRALERANLTQTERRIARRELRRQRAVEKVASIDGISYVEVIRSLPLVALVALEHPKQWPSYARILARRRPAFSAFVK